MTFALSGAWRRRSTLGILALGIAVSVPPVRQSSYTLINRAQRSFASFTFNTMSNPSLKAPQPPPSWIHTPEQVLSITKETIEATRELQTRVANLPKDARSFSSVFLALADAEAKIEAITEPLAFYQNVSPSKELRDASNEAESLVRDFGVESSMRVDVFEAIQGAAESMEKNKEVLSPESKRLVEKMLLDGKRAGLALPEEERKVLTDLKKELSQTCLEFSKNFNEENGTIAFTLEELTGVPQDVISGYKKLPGENGAADRYEITFKTPDITPVFKFASNPETRRRASVAFENRLAINEPIFKKAMALRRRLASLLGYKTWADFVTEEKMVKSADNVFKFLEDVLQKLKPVGIKDREALLALKREEHEEKGYPFDGEFYLWDYRYYDRKFVEKTLSLDDSLVKEYFPVSTVVGTILNIYQDLLGVRFQEIDAEGWHPDVQKFSVWEKDAKDETGFIGYCFLDLFPRESKYSHAAVWGLIAGRQVSPNGERNYPTTAMVANLAKATEDKPALMRHDDVVTFFHEMGHVFHGLLSRTAYSRFHGTAVARDFVEAPSQMLENWCWEPKVLKQMSSHYKTKEPLSDDLIDKLIKSRYTNVGLFYLRQGFFGMFDMKDYTALWNNLREDISLVKNDKEFKPGQGTFGHLLSGYDAGYYGYMYSLVFAADMYATVFKKDPLDPKLGKLYRDKILLPGGSRDESESLKEFLGREPNSDAFLFELFGAAPTANL
ncbi:metallopeptidase MepB [Hysterangium stoloniferum]|nr:metallopeptidase MepB [Hysterangium stoloniferum]